MTPLILGKKHIKQLESIVSKLPTPHNINTEVAGIRRYHYSVPSVAHLLGKMLIRFMKLRSSDTVGIEMVEDNNDSHKHNDSGTGRDAIFLVNIGARPFTILYTDPRTNTEYTKIMEVGTSHILSTQHPYVIYNNHNSTPAIFFTVNAHDNFSNTVRRFQHQW